MKETLLPLRSLATRQWGKVRFCRSSRSITWKKTRQQEKTENEALILTSLYNCIINIVFPHYKEMWDDDWDEEEEECIY